MRSNAWLDPLLAITGASLNLNQGTIGYTHYFGVFHRLAWVEAAVPLAGLGGSIAGTNVHGSIAGAGDSTYQIAMLLKGGQALRTSQFENYKPASSLGLSLTVAAPTGLYNTNEILNLGSDRWSFKPELAFSLPFGPDQKWEFDSYGDIPFYTDNTSYRGRAILRQQPPPGLEAHISYSFHDRAWVSLDTRYSPRSASFCVLREIFSSLPTMKFCCALFCETWRETSLSCENEQVVFGRFHIYEYGVFQELVRASQRRSAKMIVWRVTWLFGNRNPMSTTQREF